MSTVLADEKPVTDIPAAPSPQALEHFQRLLRFETDCWDVHAGLAAGHPGFVVLDVRKPHAYAAGHVPGAVNLPYRSITQQELAGYPADTLFVVYVEGSHCNGADRAAVALARLGRPVKKMIGGINGWIAEGYDLAVP